MYNTENRNLSQRIFIYIVKYLVGSLSLSSFSQSSYGGLGGDSSGCAEYVSTSSHNLLASKAFPDTGCLSLYST